MGAHAWLVVGALAAWTHTAPAEAQGPGKTGSQEQPKKARPGTSTRRPKTYTDDDLAKYRPSPPADASAPSRSGHPASAIPAPTEETTPEARSDEGEGTLETQTDPEGQEEAPGDRDGSHWRARAREARNLVVQAEAQVAGLEGEIVSLRGQALLSTDTNEILRLKDAAQRKQEELEEAQRALADARQGWTDIEEDARRQGIPRAWLEPADDGS